VWSRNTDKNHNKTRSQEFSRRQLCAVTHSQVPIHEFTKGRQALSGDSKFLAFFILAVISVLILKMQIFCFSKLLLLLMLGTVSLKFKSIEKEIYEAG
jgi:hypothetical protein